MERNIKTQNTVILDVRQVLNSAIYVEAWFTISHRQAKNSVYSHITSKSHIQT